MGVKNFLHLFLIYSYYSFCLEYWNNSETLVGIEMIKVLEKDNVTFTRQCGYVSLQYLTCSLT